MLLIATELSDSTYDTMEGKIDKRVVYKALSILNTRKVCATCRSWERCDINGHCKLVYK